MKIVERRRLKIGVNSLSHLTLLTLVVFYTTSPWTHASVGKSDYLQLVKDYADAMITHGRDTYGRSHSPLFASALNRQTMSIGSFPEIPGVRKGDRSVTGANPQTEYGLYKILYRLSAITGVTHYAEEADKALAYFFTHCQSPETGLMTWGEHLFWDFKRDARGGNDRFHEIGGAWPFWDRCYQLASEACWRFALGQWDHQIGDKESGDFSRHARWSQHGPGRGTDFPRYAGQMIACWADAYRRKENVDRPRRAELVTAITTVVQRMEANMKKGKTGYLIAGTDKIHRHIAWPKSNLELARCLWDAAGFMDVNLALRMRTLALAQDSHFFEMPHQITSGGGFVATIDSNSGLPRSRSMNKPYTTVWSSGYGYGIHASMANKCYQRFIQLKDTRPNLAKKHQKLILAAAHPYLSAYPDSNDLLKPQAIAEVIVLMLNTYQLTDDKKYQDRADSFGRMGIDLFLNDGLPLPKATNQHDHYETITGGPALMQALLQLHEVLSKCT